MAFLNAATQVLHLNVAYFGPALAGKLTNLRYVHERSQPATTSDFGVAIDPFPLAGFYLAPTALSRYQGATLCFHLSAIPGQVFADTGRKLLLKNVDGVVFVADAQVARFDANLEMWENLQIHLDEQGRRNVPIVCQVNKLDLPDVVAPEELDSALNLSGLPRIEASAIGGAGVMDTLKAIVKLLILGLQSGAVRQQDFVFLKAPVEPLRLWHLFRSDLARTPR